MSIVFEYLATIFVGILHFVMVLFPSIWVNKHFPKYDAPTESRQKTIMLVSLHVVAILTLYHTVVLLVRMIPFPLDGASGYDHSTLPYLTGTSVLSFAVFCFQDKFKARVMALFDSL